MSEVYLIMFQDTFWDAPEVFIIYKNLEEAQENIDQLNKNLDLTEGQKYFIETWELK
jgi:hypothetical protein